MHMDEGDDGTFLSTVTISYGLKKYYKGYYDENYRYEWAQDGDDIVYSWERSKLNTVNLNVNFLKKIGEKWANKISSSKWDVGGINNETAQYQNVSLVYDKEVGENKITGEYEFDCGVNVSDCVATTPYEAKVGLMYLSDYMYAVSPKYWTYVMSSSAEFKMSTAVNNNWLFMGLYEWTITRIIDRFDNYNGVFRISSYGYGSSSSSADTGSIRPTFYLKESIKYVSGTGTYSDPYRIA